MTVTGSSLCDAYTYSVMNVEYRVSLLQFCQSHSVINLRIIASQNLQFTSQLCQLNTCHFRCGNHFNV